MTFTLCSIPDLARALSYRKRLTRDLQDLLQRLEKLLQEAKVDCSAYDIAESLTHLNGLMVKDPVQIEL